MFGNDSEKPTEGAQFLPPEHETVQPSVSQEEIPAPPVPSQEEVPAQQTPAAEEVPAQQVPVPEDAPRKKSKGGLIAILAGVVVAVIAVVLALNWNNWFGVSARDYLLQVESNAISEWNNRMPAAAPEAVDMNHASTLLSIEVNQSILTALETELQNSGASVDLSWLQDVLLQVDTNINEDVSQVDIGIGANATKLLTLRAICDMPNETAYLGIPELTDTSFCAGFADMGLDMDALAIAFESLAFISEKNAQLINNLPDSNATVQLLSKYLTIAFSKVDTVAQTTETVTKGGISQEMTVLTATISEEQFRDICIAVLETAQTDSEIERILTAFCDYYKEIAEMNSVSFSEESEPSAQEILAGIPDLIEEMMADDISSSSSLVYQVYIDKQNQVCGRSLILPEDAGKLSYVIVNDGDETAGEILIQDDETNVTIAIEGTGETTTCTFVENNQEVLILDILSVDQQALLSGQLIGSFRIGVGADTWNEAKPIIASSVGIPEDDPLLDPMLDAMKPSLLLTTTSNSVAFGYCLGEMPLFNIEATVNALDAADVTVPAVALTDTDLINLLSSVNFDILMDNMTAAGMPQEYIDALQEYADMLNEMQSTSLGAA